MIQLQLPETFGTATIHGMFYEMISKGYDHRSKPSYAEDMEAGSFIFTQMNAVLDEPILMRLPVGVDVAKLNLIADEAAEFVKWARTHFKKTPKINFS